jgi:hypothetical protein
VAKHQLTELSTGERVISERVPGVRSVATGAGSRDEPDTRAGAAFHRAPSLQGLVALLGAGDREIFDELGGDRGRSRERA